MKKKLLLLLIPTIFLIGCNKNYHYTDKNTNNYKTGEISNDSIGILHNEGLDYILSVYSPATNNIDTIFNDINILQKAFFSSKGYETEDMSPELKNLLMNGDGVTWLNEIYNDGKINISSNLKGYLIDILSYINDGINEPFNQTEFYSFLDSKYSNAENSLSQSELDQLEAHIVVAKASFEYWFNPDGTPKDVVSNASRSINWWETLGTDVIGGIFGGPCGYLGASAADVFIQVIDDK